MQHIHELERSWAAHIRNLKTHLATTDDPGAALIAETEIKAITRCLRELRSAIKKAVQS